MPGESLALSPQPHPEKNLRNLLAESMPRLRRSEQKVASFLIHEGHRFSDISLSELASNTGVSQAAIVRLCQEIGLKGFRQFRLKWIEEAVKYAVQSRPQASIFERLFRELAQTESMMQTNVDRVAQVVRGAAQVFIFGAGGSGYVAQLAAESLTIAGKMAVALQDYGRLEAFHVHFGKETVLMVISHRGHNPRIEQVVAKARERGAIIVTVTSRPESPLAGLAHFLLLTAVADLPIQSLPTSVARAVQVAAIHALVDTVTGRVPSEADQDEGGD